MRILELLFPGKCPFCGTYLAEEAYRREGMCDSCARDGAIRRQGSGGTPPETMPYLTGLYCPLRYGGTVRQALTRYKFQAQNWMAAPFAALLHADIEKNDGYRGVTRITNVPISDSRFRVRGYDQSALVARRLAALTGIPYASVLERTDGGRDARAAVTSKMNLHQRASARRFRVRASCPDDVRDAQILLVDDILTTGSTLKECAELLLDAGAAGVCAAVLASGRRDLAGEDTEDTEDTGT